ncbi:MAG: PilZ domain-containing protein [Firmicutes bacterium]|nr:PilZ domain-containing protein [Bacillota bacterium]
MSDNTALRKANSSIDSDCSQAIDFAEPGTVVRLENDYGYALYRISMVMPDKTIVCRSVESPLVDGCDVGRPLTIVHSAAEGSCVIPVKIISIADRAEIIAVMPIGKAHIEERRVFPRIKPGTNVQLRLQFDNSNSRYKSIAIHDLSGGGVGVDIYAKNPVQRGLRAKLEIDFLNRQNRIHAEGEVTHCTLLNASTRQFLLGIKFIEISQADQQKIIEFVAAELKKQEARETMLREKEAKEKKAMESELKTVKTVKTASKAAPKTAINTGKPARSVRK